MTRFTFIEKLFFNSQQEGNGFLTTSTLKEILRELDPKLSEVDLFGSYKSLFYSSSLTQAELTGIIEEVDEDGSGTLDFDEFMEMMTG